MSTALVRQAAERLRELADGPVDCFYGNREFINTMNRATGRLVADLLDESAFDIEVAVPERTDGPAFEQNFKTLYDLAQAIMEEP